MVFAVLVFIAFISFTIVTAYGCTACFRGVLIFTSFIVFFGQF